MPFLTYKETPHSGAGVGRLYVYNKMYVHSIPITTPHGSI